MITPTKAYKASDGTLHATIEDVQGAELKLLVSKAKLFVKVSDSEGESLAISNEATANWMLENREAILDILTTGPRSRPTRRKVNGAPPMKRTRKAAPAADTAPISPERGKALFQELREAIA